MKVNKLLLLALGFGLALHGVAVFFTLENTYDALVHVFFADHYANNWFDAWEPRWYTGFTVQGYPPLIHQLIALLAMIGGLKFGMFFMAFAIIVLFITGVYRFTKLLSANQTVAGIAALLAVFSTSFIETLHLFGQLPGLAGLALLLHALPEIYRWSRFGQRRYLIRALVLLATTVCSHHVTPIFGMVFFILPTLGLAVMDQAAAGSGGIAQVSFRSFLKTAKGQMGRIISFGIGLLLVVVLFILPYWLNSRANPINQVPIPHGSRDNFLEITSSGLVFFLIPWGVLLLILPYIFYRFLSRRYLFFGLALTLLLILGTGGTTPIPRLILGENAFSILTLDRFTLWGSILSLPIFAEFVYRYLFADLKEDWRTRLGKGYYRFLMGGFLLLLLVSNVLTFTLGYFRPSQPDRLDMLPIVNFLNQDQHSRWRYLTLGFGDQMAWLSAQTNALTVDGNYHSARKLPELTTRPVERLENSKYQGMEGLGSLQQFLSVPEKYNLKFIFSNDKFYDPMLYFYGWNRLRPLENGVAVWERSGIPPLPAVLPRPPGVKWLNIWWGTAPILSLILLYFVFLQGNLNRWLGLSKSLVVPPSTPVEISNGYKHPWLLPVLQLWGWSLIALLLGLTAVQPLLEQPWTQPEAVVENYYKAMDDKEFENAYSYLAEMEDFSLEHFLLQIAVSDGLLNSYGKLESIQVEISELQEKTAKATAHIRWITPLKIVEKAIEHPLVREASGWRIAPEFLDPAIPLDQLLKRQDLQFFNHGRRRITTRPTFHEDILRQPQITFSDSRLVKTDTNLSLIGWMHNVDGLPADVLLQGKLFNPTGKKIASYNPGSLTKSRLMPGESAPFRITFEDTQWKNISGNRTFDPNLSLPISLDEQICNYILEPQTRVLTEKVSNGLSLNLTSADKEVLSGTIYNADIREVTIIQGLVGFYDASHSLIWVDTFYLTQSIRSQREGPFTYKLPDLSRLQNLDVLSPYPPNQVNSQMLIPVNGQGYSYISIHLNPYVANP